MAKLKEKIRRDLLRKRLALTEEEIREKSLLIKKKLFELKKFKEAEILMFYASFKNEVDTLDMIKEAITLGKDIALPVTLERGEIKPYHIQNLKEDIISGRFGIPEPKVSEEREVNIKEIDMIVVPGIAFDKYGCRIGFGQGFYDRFLHSVSPRPFCVGLGFEFQIVDAIPSQSYDEKLDMVITESHIYVSE